MSSLTRKMTRAWHRASEKAAKNCETWWCWDCGSTVEGHHTALCDLAEENAERDLVQAVFPSGRLTQWWVDCSAGRAAADPAERDLKFHPLTGVVVNKNTQLPGARAYIADA